MGIDFEILKNFVPSESLPILQKWFAQRSFKLKIVKKRVTKHGDFRTKYNEDTPQITVNSSLNQYAFLITLTHEFAHLLVWNKHKHSVKAHGKEWKNEFTLLMNVLIGKNVFPDHLQNALTRHMKNPPASSSRDEQLIKELKKYDQPSNTIYLSELKKGDIFSLNGSRVFTKGVKRRTRYLCKEVSTKREYLIHGIAEVLIVNN